MKVLNINIKIILVLLLNLVTGVVKAQQQPQFTQFMYSRLILNPALAGVEDGINATAIGRWQWVGFEGAPNTQSMTVDANIPDKNIGLGLVFSRDQVAVTTASNLQFIYSYHIPVWKGKLSMGLSAGFNSLMATYSDAYVIDNDVNFAQNTSSMAPNFGIGANYNSRAFWVGFSVPTILANSFDESGVAFYEQKRHYYLAGGYRYEVNSTFTLEPNVLLKSVEGSSMSMDLNIMSWYNDLAAVGVSYRAGESIDMLLQFKPKGQFQFGYAFDFVSNKDLRNISGSSHEVMIKYHLAWRKKDSDGDGMPDKEDECPEVAGPIENGGCPIPDVDNDGIPDAEDACPELAGIGALNGCPDSDGDGVKDSEDGCPTIKGLPEHGGCPDTDGDGIMDSEDSCPEIAGVKNLGGCPDSDGDGIADSEDKCPQVAGTLENKGCPEVKEEEKKVLDEALAGVQFQSGKNILTNSSYAILDKLAEILKSNELYQLSVSGYTDSSGNDAMNLKLSQARAESVKNYLVEKGVDSERIDAKGFGEEDPVADNNTAEGRAKNRRVEFQLVY